MKYRLENLIFLFLYFFSVFLIFYFYWDARYTQYDDIRFYELLSENKFKIDKNTLNHLIGGRFQFFFINLFNFIYIVENNSLIKLFYLITYIIFNISLFVFLKKFFFSSKQSLIVVTIFNLTISTPWQHTPLVSSMPIWSISFSLLLIFLCLYFNKHFQIKRDKFLVSYLFLILSYIFSLEWQFFFTVSTISLICLTKEKNINRFIKQNSIFILISIFYFVIYLYFTERSQSPYDGTTISNNDLNIYYLPFFLLVLGFGANNLMPLIFKLKTNYGFPVFELGGYNYTYNSRCNLCVESLIANLSYLILIFLILFVIFVYLTRKHKFLEKDVKNLNYLLIFSILLFISPNILLYLSEKYRSWFASGYFHHTYSIFSNISVSIIIFLVFKKILNLIITYKIILSLLLSIYLSIAWNYNINTSNDMSTNTSRMQAIWKLRDYLLNYKQNDVMNIIVPRVHANYWSVPISEELLNRLYKNFGVTGVNFSQNIDNNTYFYDFINHKDCSEQTAEYFLYKKVDSGFKKINIINNKSEIINSKFIISPENIKNCSSAKNSFFNQIFFSNKLEDEYKNRLRYFNIIKKFENFQLDLNKEYSVKKDKDIISRIISENYGFENEHVWLSKQANLNFLVNEIGKYEIFLEGFDIFQEKKINLLIRDNLKKNEIIYKYEKSSNKIKLVTEAYSIDDKILIDFDIIFPITHKPNELNENSKDERNLSFAIKKIKVLKLN